jgi:hypothetical protein
MLQWYVCHASLCFHGRVAEGSLLGLNLASLDNKFTVFGGSLVVSSSRVFLDILTSEDETTWLSQIIGNQVPSDMMSHPSWTEPSDVHHVTAICASFQSEICFVLYICIVLVVLSLFQQHCVMLQWYLHHFTLISSSCYADIFIMLRWYQHHVKVIPASCYADTCIMLQWYLHHFTLISSSCYADIFIMLRWYLHHAMLIPASC